MFFLQVCQVLIRARICKRLRSPGIDSMKSIPPAYVAYSGPVGTTTIFIIGWLNRFLGIDSWAPEKFTNSGAGLVGCEILKISPRPSVKSFSICLFEIYSMRSFLAGGVLFRMWRSVKAHIWAPQARQPHFKFFRQFDKIAQGAPPVTQQVDQWCCWHQRQIFRRCQQHQWSTKTKVTDCLHLILHTK